VTARLPAMTCPMPACGRPMSNRAYTPNARGGAPTASSYDRCLRQCSSCGIGVSNGRSKTTIIHRDPLQNVPVEVRAGASDTLAAALNVRNRPTKLIKFGFDTSEDAVTWTVFSYLHRHQRQALAGLYQGLFGIPADGVPELLLWGVPVQGDSSASSVGPNLVAVSDALGEVPASRSEPDVVLDFGSAGVVVIEVKYRSGNSKITRPSKFDRYVDGSPAFTNPATVKASGLYELTRNWRIAHDLAAGRPFVLVNLTMDGTLTSTRGLPGFVASLATSTSQRFLPVSWRDFLIAARQATDCFPPWLDAYCHARGLR